MKLETKLVLSKSRNYSEGISRANPDGSPRRGWTFCEHPACVEIIRKRRGPRCEKHQSKETPC